MKDKLDLLSQALFGIKYKELLPADAEMLRSMLKMWAGNCLTPSDFVEKLDDCIKQHRPT